MVASQGIGRPKTPKRENGREVLAAVWKLGSV